MPEQRRKFSPQFKAEAVQMVIETGRPVASGTVLRRYTRLAAPTAGGTARARSRSHITRSDGSTCSELLRLLRLLRILR
jgi:hypothetical protein